MKITGNAVKTGMVIIKDDRLWKVTKTQHTQPGKGGAYVQAELKDILSGTKSNARFRSSENVERAVLEQYEYNYLYVDGDNFVFMNNETFEQIEINKSLIDENYIPYLQEGMNVQIERFQEQLIGIKLPDSVALEVVETEAVIKGQTVTTSYKPAVLENGVKTAVPPHINAGMKIMVNTSDNSYVEKVK